MLSQSRSLEFFIVQSVSYSKLYFTFWAWLDYRIKQNFEDGKYKMIKTEHQKFFVIGVSWSVPYTF